MTLRLLNPPAIIPDISSKSPDTLWNETLIILLSVLGLGIEPCPGFSVCNLKKENSSYV